jgi:hypothetical protein
VSEFNAGLIEGISGVSGAEYLHFLAALGYRLAVIRKQGETVEGDVDAIMAAYTAAWGDHIDILALPAP